MAEREKKSFAELVEKYTPKTSKAVSTGSNISQKETAETFDQLMEKYTPKAVPVSTPKAPVPAAGDMRKELILSGAARSMEADQAAGVVKKETTPEEVAKSLNVKDVGERSYVNSADPMTALKTMLAFREGDRKAAQEDVERSYAERPGMQGFQQGLLGKTDAMKYVFGDLDTHGAEEKGVYKAGDVAGTMASFAIPYGAFTGTVAKAPKVASVAGKVGAKIGERAGNRAFVKAGAQAAKKGLAGEKKAVYQDVVKRAAEEKWGKAGKKAVESVAADLVIGTPLNAHQTFNVEGLRGEEATKNLLLNMGLDVVAGAAIEAIPAAVKGVKDADLRRVEEDFMSQVRDVMQGKKASHEVLTLGNTPKILQKYGASNNILTMRQDTVRKIAYPKGYLGLEKGHNLGFEALQKLPESLRRPAAILKSDTQDNSFVIFTRMLDRDGRPVMAALHLDKKGNIGLSNEVASMYGRQNYEDFIRSQREKGGVLFEDKKMGLDGLLLNGLQLSERETSSDPIFNVPQKGEKSTSKVSLPGPGEPKIGSLGDKFRQIAEKAGAQVVYADLPEGVNGLYRHGIIAISKRAPNQALETAKHELTHHLENSGYYSDFADFIKKELRGRGYDVEAAIKEIQEDYGKKGIVLDEDGGSREFVAKFTEEFLFRDEASIERLARENPNLFQRIYEWIRGTLAKVGIGKDSWFLWEAQKKYEKALRNVGEIKDRGTQFRLIGKRPDGIEVYETGTHIQRMPYKDRMNAFMSIMRNEYAGRTAKFVADDEVYYARFDEEDLRKNVYGDKKSSLRGWKAKINTGADGNIFELVENATHSGSGIEEGKVTAAHQGLTGWEYFVKTVQIDGVEYDLLANVRKKPDGEFVYSIQLNEQKNKASAPPGHYPKGKAKAENRPVRVPTDTSTNSIMGGTIEVNKKLSTGRRLDELPVPGQDRLVALKKNPRKMSAEKGLSLMEKAYSRTVDDLYAASKVGEEMKIRAQNTRKATGTAQYAIEEGLVDRAGRDIAPRFSDGTKASMKNLFRRADDIDLAKFNEYLLHKHNIARFKEDKPIFGDEVSDKVSERLVAEIEKNHPEFRELGELWNKTNQGLVREWLVGSGLISKEFGEKLLSRYKDYVPTYREGSVSGEGWNSRTLKANTVVKTAEGGNRPVIAPHITTGMQIQKVVKAARQNEVYKALLDAVRKDPEGMRGMAALSQDASGKYKGAEIQAGMERDMIQNNGLDGIDDYMEEMLGIDKYSGNYYVTAMENGKPVRMIVHKDLYTALSNLNRTGDQEVASKILSAISNFATKPFKTLVTGVNPFFGVRNFLRDVPTAYLQGTVDNPIKFVANMADAAKQVARKDPLYEQYKALGGKMQGYYNTERGLAPESLPTKLGRGFAQAVGVFNETLEAIPRYGEYLGSLKRDTGFYGADKALREDLIRHADEDTLQRALYNSGEVTVNFARKGDVTKEVDKAVPYLNAAVQGIDRAVRSLSRPQSWAKGIGALTIPSLGLLYINYKVDREGYDKLDNRTKDTYYLIPMGDSQFIKLPKSRESGVLFVTLAERLIRQMTGQEDAFKDFRNTVATNFAPQNPITNSIVAPALYYLPQNKDFANRTIVPQAMVDDGRSKYLQYDDSTSAIGKWVGQVAADLGINDGQGLSPKQIDYLIDSYTGLIGDILLPATTQGESWIENVATRPFTADSVYSNRAQSDFYDAYDAAKRASADLNLTGDVDGEYRTPEEERVSVYLAASKKMAKLRKESNRIQATMAPGRDRSEELRRLREEINQIALRTPKEAEAAYEEYRRTYIPEISTMSDHRQSVYRAYLKNTGLEPLSYRDLIENMDIDGNGSISQEEARARLDASELSDQQKAYMWLAINKSWKKNPYQ